MILRLFNPWDFSITATVSSSVFNITQVYEVLLFVLATFQIFQCNLAEERIGTKFLQEHQVIHDFYPKKIVTFELRLVLKKI